MVMTIITGYDTIKVISDLKIKKGHIDEIAIVIIKENKNIR